MNATMEERRRPVPSIATVYQPIEEYWEASRPVGLPDGGPSESLDPLDAFLVHRLLELVPRHPVLVDAAIAPTGGASSLIGIHHPRVCEVWAVVDNESLPSRRAMASLRDHAGRLSSTPAAPLKVVDRTDLTGGLAQQPGAIILTDARAGDDACLAGDIGRWLDTRPEALVLVLGVGRVGECPAIASLLSLSGPGSNKKLWLLRELSEVLMGSHLAIVARREHPDIATVLKRLEQYYTGNHQYVDLLWRANRAALRDARIDEEVLRGNVTFGPISQEIEDLKRAVREANERAAAAARELAAAGDATSPLLMLRRTLSPTPVGQAWRIAKRARTRLSPTPIGRAYRFTKKVALKCASLGR
jgi:hypothetical protein